MQDSQIVITGMGAVTPIGIGVDSYWKNLLLGRSGIDYITRFDSSALPVHIAAEVRNFVPETCLSRNCIRASSLFMQFALVAAEEALADSCALNETPLNRVGVLMATAMGGIVHIADTQTAFLESHTKKVSPHFVPAVINNMAAAQLTIAHGITGPSLTIDTACSAGGDALMAATFLLRSGAADAVLVMGGESILSALTVSSLSQAKALSRNNDDPAHACRPFDALRDGFVIGEGGGALLVETKQNALRRHADIKAVLLGYANTIDGYHITAPQPDGSGAAACMRIALENSGLSLEKIGYINAHGTSTILGDRAETSAIKKVFGAKCPPVSSTKAATGHMMGAGGITEVIACIQAIRNSTLPPTLNYSEKDPQCDLDYIPEGPRKVDISAAMSNAMGFGGQNSCIIVSRFEE